MTKSNHFDIPWKFNNSYANLPEHFFTRISPIKVSCPHVVVLNYALGKDLGLNFNRQSNEQLAQLFSGNLLPAGSEPIAQAYAGHQFGYFTFLGDGRAHLLGEHVTPDGKRVDIQLKGSGQTPYGLKGDGRAGLGPMLREYAISEAMHALGVPTTRSLAVVKTGEDIYRETIMPGAVLTRVASSHLRVGTFEYLLAQNDIHGINILADYAILRHFNEARQSEHPYLHLLELVIARQIHLIVQWMRVGFIHGVMNTDNMALSGETIDYGPCAFMDSYDPATVFSFIDHMGRYSYANQPAIAQWNLARFAETLLPLLHADNEKALAMANDAINQFPILYQSQWLNMMRTKLGLFGEHDVDHQLILDLLHWMHQYQADYTNTFRDLSEKERPADKTYDNKTFQEWYERWLLRLQKNNEPHIASLDLMKASNPCVIPRNHKVNEALDMASNNDFKPFHDLLNAITDPYNNRTETKLYQLPPTASERVCNTFCGT